ncbi:MAG: pseudouridine synthase, partial [Pseudomonadota bacterium]
MLIAFNKPYGVLSQFTTDGSKNRTLAEFRFPKNVYPLGRLDADSEGLLFLSDEPGLNALLLNPERGHSRTYWAQVENIPSGQALKKLQGGVGLGPQEILPCSVWVLDPQPALAERIPPIRVRK